ncbi:mucin-5AC-like [Drosophila subobscura]|uniref:mucin-5AC-like n=1 Tax=Drosophila subobscura TaxID=7241 RepID=UPI00155AC660|nr:mucin-5AC-like [Drosophila subobscura]
MYPMRVSSTLCMFFLIRMMFHFQVLKAAPISQSVEAEPSEFAWREKRASTSAPSSETLDDTIMITMPDRRTNTPEVSKMIPEDSPSSSTAEIQSSTQEATPRRTDEPQRVLQEVNQKKPEESQRNSSVEVQISSPEEFQRNIPAEPQGSSTVDPQNKPEEPQRSSPEAPQSISTVIPQRRLEETQGGTAEEPQRSITVEPQSSSTVANHWRLAETQTGTPEDNPEEAAIGYSTTTKPEPQTRTKKQTQTQGSNNKHGHPPDKGLRMFGLKSFKIPAADPQMDSRTTTTANVINESTQHQTQLTIPLARTYGLRNLPWRAVKNTWKQMDYEDVWMDTRLAIGQYSRIPRIRMASNPLVNYYPDDAKLGTVCKQMSTLYGNVAWERTHSRFSFFPHKIYMRARTLRKVDKNFWNRQTRNRCHTGKLLTSDINKFLYCEIQRHMYMSAYCGKLTAEQLIDVEI